MTNVWWLCQVTMIHFWMNWWNLRNNLKWCYGVFCPQSCGIYTIYQFFYLYLLLIALLNSIAACLDICRRALPPQLLFDGARGLPHGSGRCPLSVRVAGAAASRWQHRRTGLHRAFYSSVDQWSGGSDGGRWYVRLEGRGAWERGKKGEWTGWGDYINGGGNCRLVFVAAWY